MNFVQGRMYPVAVFSSASPAFPPAASTLCCHVPSRPRISRVLPSIIHLILRSPPNQFLQRHDHDVLPSPIDRRMSHPPSTNHADLSRASATARNPPCPPSISGALAAAQRWGRRAWALGPFPPRLATTGETDRLPVTISIRLLSRAGFEVESLLAGRVLEKKEGQRREGGPRTTGLQPSGSGSPEIGRALLTTSSSSSCTTHSLTLPSMGSVLPFHDARSFARGQAMIVRRSAHGH